MPPAISICLHSLYMVQVKRNSLVCAFAFTHRIRTFKQEKLPTFFVWVTVSVTPLCVVIGLQSLLKGDAQMMAQVPADSADAASSFPLLTTAW